jgi:hypothetical protein
VVSEVFLSPLSWFARRQLRIVGLVVVPVFEQSLVVEKVSRVCRPIVAKTIGLEDLTNVEPGRCTRHSNDDELNLQTGERLIRRLGALQ